MIRAILFTVLCLLFFQNLTAQSNGYWQPVNTPPGFFGNFYHANGDTCFAITYQHRNTFRSTDKGQTWEPFDVPVLDSTSLFYSVSEAGHLFKVLPSNQSGQYKIYRSPTSTAVWTSITDDAPVYNITEGPDGTLIGLSHQGIHRSLDGGVNWPLTYEDPYLVAGSINNFKHWGNGRVSISIGVDKSYFSIDNGLTWIFNNSTTQLSNGFHLWTSDGKYYIASGTTMVRSDDNGATWTTIDSSHVSYDSYGGLAELEGNKLMIVTNNGKIYHSTNDGGNWIEAIVTSPDFPTRLYGIFPDGDLIGFGKNSLMRSTDDGATWSLASGNMSYAFVNNLEFFNNTQYASTRTGFWKSEDAGITWNRMVIQTEIYPDVPRELSAFWNVDSFVVMPNDTTLLRSFNGGVTFENITPAAMPFLTGNFYIDKTNNQIFVNTIDGLSYSTNYGNDWSLCFPNVYMGSMAKHPNGTLYLQSSNTWKLYASNDGGETWMYQNLYGLALATIKTSNVQMTVLYMSKLKNPTVRNWLSLLTTAVSG